VNGAWNDTARLNIGFDAKGPNKTQIAIQISKLGDAAEVESERERWKAALDTLANLLAAGDANPTPRSKTRRADRSLRRTSTAARQQLS
jgi:hypothetical protein